MTLVTAGFAIAGLLAMSIPILIHLLSRQRRKPVEWAAMKFLLEAYRKHKRRLQIEQLILLALRCLIIGLFGLALARPLLKNAGILDAGGDRIVYIVLDDGLASSVTDDDGSTTFDAHRDAAIRFVQELAPGDTVGVVLASQPVEIMLNPPTADHGAVVRLLEGLEPKASATDLDGAMRVLMDAVADTEAGTEDVTVFLLSEFREGSATLDAPLPAWRERRPDVRLVTLQPAVQTPTNVQVESIEPVSRVVLSSGAAGREQILVRLARQGDSLERDVSRVRLSGDGMAPVEPRAVTWDPGQTSADVEFMIDPIGTDDGEIVLTAEIDHDAVPDDNVRHVLLDLRERLRILLIDRRRFGFEPSVDRLSAGSWMRRALEPIDVSPMEVVEVEPAALDIADIRTTDAIILVRPDLIADDGWELIRTYVDAGGLLFIAPPGELNVHQWTETFTQAMDLAWTFDLEVDEPGGGLALADVQPATEVLSLLSSELEVLAPPVRVYRRLRVDTTDTDITPVLDLTDGSPLLIAGTPRTDTDGAVVSSNGLVLMLLAAPELAWTNLPSKPLMVPLAHELVRQGLSSIRSSVRHMVGARPRIRAMYADARALEHPDGGAITIDDSDGRPVAALTRSGVYTVRDRGNQSMGLMAVNVDPQAGNITAQSPEQVDLWLKASGDWSVFAADASEQLAGERDEGAPLAMWLLIAVLALVTVETVLARIFSHATRQRRESTGLQGSVRGAMGGSA
ncbi:MAG: BatA domain-containing protein [Planctomycetota bacterium]